MRYLGFLSLFLVFWGSIKSVVGDLELVRGQGLRWCDDFCLCPLMGEERLQCMASEDIYSILNFNEIQIIRLNRVGWNPISSLKWCSAGRCFCHKESNKAFACVEVPDYLERFVNASALKLEPDDSGLDKDETPLNVAGFGISDSDVSDPMHRKRDMDEERRNRRRNRKNRKNRKRNRNEGKGIGYDDFSYEENSSQEILPAYEDPDQLGHSSHDDLIYPDPQMLPKQEAINSSPMVTAMQPPTRKEPLPPTTTQLIPILPPTQNQSMPVMEPSRSAGSKPKFSERMGDISSPVFEVPMQRKTVAGKVSEDLKQITEDVQHIRSDVVFNQRILLVTVGVAGVAMLGWVLWPILRPHQCCATNIGSFLL